MYTGDNPNTTETRTGTAQRISTRPVHSVNPSAVTPRRYAPKDNSDARYFPSAPMANSFFWGFGLVDDLPAAGGGRPRGSFNSILNSAPSRRGRNECGEGGMARKRHKEWVPGGRGLP